MATQLQRRRGTDAEHASFTGALAEWTYATDTNRIHTHDGSKTGGYPIPNYQDIQNGAFSAVDASGTDTITLDLEYAPEAYAEYQMLWFKPSANNTGAVTVNINSLGAKDLQKDDGSGTPTALEADDLKAGIPVMIIYDGTRFILQATGGSGILSLVGSYSPSGVSSVDITSVLTTGNYYEIVGTNITPSSDGVAFFCNVSENNGSSFFASGYRRSFVGLNSNNIDISEANNSAGTGKMVDNVGSSANESVSFVVRVYNPSTTGEDCYFSFETTSYDDSGYVQVTNGCLSIPSKVLNAVRFEFQSGNIESGEIAVYERSLS
jgi:hypothetical protein